MSHSSEAHSMITVLLDQKPHQLALGTTLEAFIAGLPELPTACATAVNGMFVSRTRRLNYVLQSGDAVLLFQPIVGG